MIAALTLSYYALNVVKASPGGIADLASLVLLAGENQTYFIYANPDRMTRAVATYDVASGGIVYGMCLHLQNQDFDTNAEWVSQNQSDNGRLLLTGSAVLMFGGPVPHWCVNYLETQRLMPVYFKNESLGDGVHLEFIENSTGTALVDRLETSINFTGEDYFVLMTSTDFNNNHVFVSYGFDWKGTWGAGIYTKAIVFNITSYTNSYYILHWVDANGDGIPQPSEMTQVATG
jgi:hypothetical protein